MMTASAARTNDIRLAAGLVAAVLVVQVAVERLMGRIWICACGEIKLFEPGVNSAGNSQHISDWYTPSHIEHGFIFFGLTWLFLRRHPLSLRLGLALLLESGWEILENTPLIIDRYRAATISLDYYGDSILNSAMDTLMMVTGFLIASRLPWKLTLGLALAAELLTLAVIRDNLTLNVLMLIHPIEAIRTWQGGL